MDENEALPDMVMPHCPHRSLLRGQKALVTGASSGIGKGVAIHLAQQGADVASREDQVQTMARALVGSTELRLIW